jgi:hypothetical protein
LAGKARIIAFTHTIIETKMDRITCPFLFEKYPILPSDFTTFIRVAVKGLPNRSKVDH